MTAIRSRSVTGRVRQFFVDNPDEELTRADLMAKFSCSSHSVDATLLALRNEGFLETVHVTRLRAKGIASHPPASRGAVETRQPEEEMTP